jgi:hypothetical protein
MPDNVIHNAPPPKIGVPGEGGVVEGGEVRAAEKAGHQIINVPLTVSRAEGRANTHVASLDHDLRPPAPDSMRNNAQLDAVVKMDLSGSADLMALVWAVSAQLREVGTELLKVQHDAMSDARMQFKSQMDDKASSLRKQGSTDMWIGIASSAVGGAFSVAGGVYGFKGANNPQLAAMKGQSVMGVGGAIQGIGQAVQKNVDARAAAAQSNNDKFAQLFQSYQSEFNDGVSGAKELMRMSMQAFSDAQGKYNNIIITATNKIA